MMRRTPLLVLPVLALATAGLAGCHRGAQEPAASSQAASTAAAPGQPAAAVPGQPSPAATAGSVGSPATAAKPGAPGFPPLGASPPPEQPVDPSKLPAVVARVNGQEISKGEFLQQVAGMRQQIARMTGNVHIPVDAQFYHQALDSLVGRVLLEQEAKQQGVTVSDAEIDQQIASLRSGFPDDATFKKALASQGTSEEKLRQEMRREGPAQKLLQTKILTDVQVSDQAAKTFYEQNPDQMKQPERLHLRHILVRVEPKMAATDKERAKAKAEQLRERATKGEDFAKLASESSDDPGSKARGGDLGWVARGQSMPPTFEKAAWALAKPNELSPVVESPFGYHVIQLIERQAPSVAPFEAVKPRITEFLRQRQSQEKLQQHVQALRAKAKVETYL